MSSDDSGKETPRPFLKWAGGKRKLLPHILPRLGGISGTYFEPFLGAGATFLALEEHVPKIAGDINKELVTTWNAIKDNPEGVINCLRPLDNSKATFLRVRDFDRDPSWDLRSSPEEKAARTIFLNKTCFNGLYRVNSSGFFNVPYAALKNPRILDADNLQQVSAFLNALDRNQKTPAIENCSYVDLVAQASAGDVVYFDPPYAPLSSTSSFVGYDRQGFGDVDQLQLRNTCLELMDRGVRVLISNSNAQQIRDLYKPALGFRRTKISVSRLVAAAPSSRAPISELLIVGKPR